MMPTVRMLSIAPEQKVFRAPKESLNFLSSQFLGNEYVVGI